MAIARSANIILESPKVPHDGDIRGVSDSETGWGLRGIGSRLVASGYFSGVGLDANALGCTGSATGKTGQEVRN